MKINTKIVGLKSQLDNLYEQDELERAVCADRAFNALKKIKKMLEEYRASSALGRIALEVVKDKFNKITEEEQIDSFLMEK